MDGRQGEFHKEYSLQELEELKFAAELTPFEVLSFFSLVDKVNSLVYSIFYMQNGLGYVDMQNSL